MKEKTVLERIYSNPFIQTFVIYVSCGWIILEIADYFIENFSLQESIRNILLIILLCIFPIVVVFAILLYKKQRDIKKELDKEPVSESTLLPGGRYKKLLFSLKKPQFLFPGILIIVAIVTTVIFRIQHQSQVRFALDYSIPSLKTDFEQLLENPLGGDNWSVYLKAVELRNILEENPDLDKVWYDMTVPLTISTNPPGAKVYIKPYSKPDTSWHFIGETPLNGFPFPRGLSRVKIERVGFKTQFDVILRRFGRKNIDDSIHYQLFKESEVPEDMVHVPGDEFLTPLLPDTYISSFWIDCYEVTNKEYKAFLDAGGYANSSYWEFPFIFGDDTIPYADAMNKFVDETGWTGPANWQLGEFSEGAGDLPVTGISWYEAAAYARSVNKSLPTIFHWSYVSESNAAPEIVKFSNFNHRAPVEKGTYNSMTRFGTYDLPGNVSEWIYNSSRNDRYVLGGNFKEPTYMFNMKLQSSPWTRNELIGFRCMKYIENILDPDLIQNLDQGNRDYTNLQPVSDEIFQVYKDLLEFERIDLNPTIISQTITEDWSMQTISVEVPYEDAPMKILIWLPVDYKPPYQAIVYFPGLGSHKSNSMTGMNVHSNFDFFLKSGRAIIWPVYYSSHGRGEINITNINAWKQTYKNIIIDAQTTVDYLQTRNDIDSENLVFYGSSWGGAVAPYILAIEERFKLGILRLFGVSSVEKYRFKEFDQIDYIPHVEIPMLLLGGRYDPDYTMEQQQAFYDFLGTPKSDIKWMVYETTHYIPRKDLINESLSWLDKYLGPVNK